MSEWTKVSGAAKDAQGNYIALINGSWTPVSGAAKDAQGNYIALVEPKSTAPVEQEQSPSQDSAIMKYGVRPATEIAGAVFDPLATIATGTVGKIASDIAGLGAIPLHAAGIISKEPSQIKTGIQEAIQYRPKTELGKLTTYPIEQIGKGIESVAETAVSPIENEYLRAGVKEALLQTPGLYGAKTIPKTIAAAETKKAIAKPRDEARLSGENIGLIAPPEGGAIRRTIYSTGRAADAVSLKNQQKATSAIARDVGLPENAPITKDIISERRAILNKSYEDFANAFPNGVRISNSFTNKMKARLADVQNKLSVERETFKELEGVPDVLQEQIGKAVGIRDAKGMIDSISALRSKATSAFMTGNDKSAKIYRDIADGYEAAMSEQLKTSGNVSLYSQFENARKQHAKLHFVEQIVDPVSGLVDFNQLRSKSGSNIAKEKYLSGETKIVADFARQFKTATKQLAPDQIASLGKWEMAVPLAATTGALGAGAGAGMMFGSPILGAAMTAIPAAIGTASPMLGQAGLLRRTPSYSPAKSVAGMGLLGVSQYAPEEQQ